MPKFPRMNQGMEQLSGGVGNITQPVATGSQFNQIGPALDKVNSALATAKAQDQNLSAVKGALAGHKLQFEIDNYLFDVEQNPDKYPNQTSIAKGFSQVTNKWLGSATNVRETSSMLSVVNKNRSKFNKALIATKQNNIDMWDDALTTEHKKMLQLNPDINSLEYVVNNYEEMLNNTNLSVNDKRKMMKDRTAEYAELIYQRLYDVNPRAGRRFIQKARLLFKKDTDFNQMDRELVKKELSDAKHDLDLAKVEKDKLEFEQLLNYEILALDIDRDKSTKGKEFGRSDILSWENIVYKMAGDGEVSPAQAKSLMAQITGIKTLDQTNNFAIALDRVYNGTLTKDQVYSMVSAGELNNVDAVSLISILNRDLKGIEKDRFNQVRRVIDASVGLHVTDAGGVYQASHFQAKKYAKVQKTFIENIKKLNPRDVNFENYKNAYEDAFKKHYKFFNPNIKHVKGSRFNRMKEDIEKLRDEGKSIPVPQLRNAVLLYRDEIDYTKRKIIENMATTEPFNYRKGDIDSELRRQLTELEGELAGLEILIEAQ